MSSHAFSRLISPSSNSNTRRVAQLAAAGLPNRDIAQNLFITTRTVEGHLTHAYQKLDITNREQLPAALASDER
jgi:DNA-binding NarL/FixJ family response regulator